MPDNAVRDEALSAIEGMIDDAARGLLANLQVVESRPTDREAGIRVRSHLVELDRLLAIRHGFRAA